MNKLCALLSFGLAGCNFDVGDCYLRSEGESGAGGVILTATGVGGYGFGPTGAGGFGPVPPLEPQDMDPPSPPVCNIASQTPCEEKCEADSESDNIQCGKMESEAQRAACQDSAYARYKGCREGCERTSNKSCDEKYQDCVNRGPWSCARPGSGSDGTKCRTCFRRCESGDPPSSDCKKCLF
jgi:hypothetical protein